MIACLYFSLHLQCPIFIIFLFLYYLTLTQLELDVCKVLEIRMAQYIFLESPLPSSAGTSALFLYAYSSTVLGIYVVLVSGVARLSELAAVTAVDIVPVNRFSLIGCTNYDPQTIQPVCFELCCVYFTPSRVSSY